MQETNFTFIRACNSGSYCILCSIGYHRYFKRWSAIWKKELRVSLKYWYLNGVVQSEKKSEEDNRNMNDFDCSK